MNDYLGDAHAVLLPVVAELTQEPWLQKLLAQGTVSVLIAETREEYVARAMTPARRRSETREDVSSFSAGVRTAVGGPTLVVLDQEPWGIQRLHDLVRGFPLASELTAMNDAEIEKVSADIATAARQMGVNTFLSPVVDVLTGDNAWLRGRTLELEPAEVGRIAAAFVRGVQTAGVVAVAKHFPGYPQMAKDPALHDVAVRAEHSQASDLEPFAQVVRAGVRCVMTGPAIVEAVDPAEPSSTSKDTIDLLRNELEFRGLVVSDDLDAPATMRGRTVAETAVASIIAGADLLLLVGGDDNDDVTAALSRRASDDAQFAERLTQAAARVRELAAGTDRD